MPTTPAMAEAVAALALLIVAVLAAVLLLLRLRLRLTAAAGDESGQARHLRAFVDDRPRIRLRLLMLRTAVLRLVARRERLRIARNEWLALLRHRLLRHVARLVLAQERLAIVVAVVVAVVGGALRSTRDLLTLLIVVGVLLAELLLRSGNQTKVMFSVLIVILGRDRIARALRIARELDVFFRDMRGGATDFYVGAVRLIDPRQRILALAVVVIVTTPHALLTVSHDVPVRRPFASPRHEPPNALR
jgi:hypothetical protein